MKNKLSVSGIITSIFIFFLPFILLNNIFYPETNGKYFYVISFITIIGLIFSFKAIKGDLNLSNCKRPLLYISIITLMSYFLSSYLGVNFERSLWSDIIRSTGLLFLSALLLGSFFLSELLSKKDWKVVFSSISISSLIVSILTYFGPGLIGFFPDNNLTFGNETFVGAYLFLGLVITLIQFYSSDNKKIKRIFGIIALVQFLSPLFINYSAIFSGAVFSNPISLLGYARASGAAAILLAVYLGISYLIKKYFKDKEDKIKISIIILMFLFVFGAVSQLFVSGSFIQNKYIESSTAARILVWESGLEAYKEKPLLGWGFENFGSAHEKYLNNDLYLRKNIGEIWFDKAHNVFVDTLVTVGVLGSLLSLLTIAVFIFVVIRAYKKDLINKDVAYLLGLVFVFHILQIQTSFDSVSTYTLISIIFAFGFSLEKGLFSKKSEKKDLIKYLEKTVGIVVFLLVLAGAYKLGFEEYKAQTALFKVFDNTVSNEERVENIGIAFDNNIDFESLRFASASLIKGAYSQLATSNPESFDGVRVSILNQLDIYEGLYSEYLGEEDRYRVRMNYAYLLLTRTIFGDDRLEEAKDIIDNSYGMSPENPLTYVLDSMTYLYSGNIGGSISKINEAVNLNPEIRFTQDVKKQILRAEEQFPNIPVIKLQNL